MSIEDELKSLLVEIRDNQRESMRFQREHLELAAQQLERSRTQVAESIELQREAIGKTRMIFGIAIPGVVLCIGLIIYLLVRYF